MLIKFNDLLFLSNKVNGIIHIGAHELEELSDYLKRNVSRVIWIEANPKKYELIEKKLEKFQNMTLGKFAAGSKNGTQILNVANNGQSSSLLELGTHKINYPKINFNSKIKVDTKNLDDWLDENIKNKNFYNFINLDIQGYELEALKGMTKQLEISQYIYMEVNFEQVYLGCPELKEIDKFLLEFGFKRVALKKTSKGWGDALYSKNNFLIMRIYYLFFLKLIKLPNSIKNFFQRDLIRLIKRFLRLVRNLFI